MPPRRRPSPIPDPLRPAFQLLAECGVDPTTSDLDTEFIDELEAGIGSFASEPRSALLHWTRAKIELRKAKRAARRAAAAAREAANVVAAMVEAKPILAHLELFRDREPPSAYCRVGSQTREFAIYPEVNLDQLREWEPWHYALVHPEEPVLVGVADDPALFQLAQGDVVELRRVDPKDPSRAFITRHEHDECVVTLAPSLRGLSLQPPAKLVLQRDDERFAIAVIDAVEQQGRFEVSLDSIRTGLDDLAGVEEVVKPLIDDIFSCILRPEIRESFDLRPLTGALLYSYKPGTGKTSVVCAIGAWLRDLGTRLGFEVALYQVKPNELKSVWHGGDARLVRDELCGSIRARAARPREVPLLQLVLLDELDSLGVRSSGNDGNAMYSPAQNDAVQALLAEMDGFNSHVDTGDGPPAHVLWIGLTNLPDGIDGALKRPGRFGDLVVEMPETTIEVAESVMAIYLGRHRELPWLIEGKVRTGLEEEEVRRHFLRPALRRVWGEIVLRYTTEGNREVEVTAGEVLANVHYMQAASEAKKRAAVRRVHGSGPPAVGFDDVLTRLLEQATSTAGQMAADHSMMRRQLRITGPLNRVTPIPAGEIGSSEFLREAAHC
jgi:ATP-dependent 26S proteasome regulatory subunit